MQRVRCNKLPAVVAMFRSWADRAAQNRFGKNGVVLANERMVRQIRIADHRANRQAAVGKRFDFVERQPIDVDQRLRLLDIQLHQIDQRCPAAR